MNLVTELCKKANKKLQALARISNYTNKDKSKLILKSFIESQFGYCPLVWMLHSRKLNYRINRLHESGLRLVYKDKKLTFDELKLKLTFDELKLTFDELKLTLDELLRKDNSFTIHHRNLQKLAIEMYKIENNLSPSIMSTVFPRCLIPYNLRSANNFETSNVRTVHFGTETISFIITFAAAAIHHLN